jgi:hypothetical protein
MPTFREGDQVTVTNPMQPTSHQVGDTGVVVDTRTIVGVEVVQIQNDRDGSLQAVYPAEIAKS